MSETLKPWYAVATPHEDIRKGRLEEAVFAANIWAVVQGTAPEVYLDPEEFYLKTFMTVGLAAVLKRVAAALRGDGESGDRIVSLQTAFGGGKTHVLVALWHLARHGVKLKKSPAAEELRRLLGERFPEDVRGVAVFTNESCDATQGRVTPDGVHTRTLWGELALQLGGPKLYEKVRKNDETQRVPQGIFLGVLREAAPCLILLDELADYCVGAAAVPVGDTTLADQTISFIQQLTEAVHQVPRAMVVATLPASKYEVAQSEKGQEAFVTLERRFQRLGADVKPVADDEIYDVVRARLLETVALPQEADYPARVAHEYQSLYAAHAGEVPTEASKNTFREQIERAYPFHPILIDALYTRWGSHPDFQRTRGVLRLLASVVGDLWQRREGNTQTQHLIQPCHVRWSIDAMQAALTRLWGPAYQSVAAADVLGEKSNAGALDEERGGDYRREQIAQGLGAAIMMGSFGGKAQRSGFSGKDLKLACSRVGLNWSYTDGALLELENRCFYLHTTAAGSLGKRYWFGTKPTLTKLVVQYRQQVARESFDEEILEELRAQTRRTTLGGATWRVVVDPESDLPEQKSLTLLILPPSLVWGDGDNGKEAVVKRVFELSNRCGAKDRTYRNTLLFLVASPRGLSKLRQTLRERAALEGVRTDYSNQLDEDQKQDLEKRFEAAKRACLEALGPAYTAVLRVAGQEMESCSLVDARANFQEHLGYVWNTLVEDEEWILRRVGTVTLQQVGLIPGDGGVRVKEATEAFLRFTDKPMVASKTAVTDGLAQACQDGIVGIGRGGSLSELHARYCKQTVSLDPNEDGVWIIPPFEPDRPEVTEKIQRPGLAEGEVAPKTETVTIAVEEEQAGATTAKTIAGVRRLVVRGAVPVESWADLFRSFVGPGTRLNLKKLRLGVEFDMELPEGQELDPNDPRIKAMHEAARQLGLSFEVNQGRDRV
jgi:hypothetical protein